MKIDFNTWKFLDKESKRRYLRDSSVSVEEECLQDFFLKHLKGFYWHAGADCDVIDRIKDNTFLLRMYLSEEDEFLKKLIGDTLTKRNIK